MIVSWVDASTRRYYLADRSNAGVDVVDTVASQFVTRITGDFAGADPRGNDLSGPNGVVVIHEAAEPGEDEESESGRGRGDEHRSADRVHELWPGHH